MGLRRHTSLTTLCFDIILIGIVLSCLSKRFQRLAQFGYSVHLWNFARNYALRFTLICIFLQLIDTCLLLRWAHHNRCHIKEKILKNKQDNHLLAFVVTQGCCCFFVCINSPILAYLYWIPFFSLPNTIHGFTVDLVINLYKNGIVFLHIILHLNCLTAWRSSNRIVAQ